jgi:alpha-1,2-mannosyltransferase
VRGIPTALALIALTAVTFVITTSTNLFYPANTEGFIRLEIAAWALFLIAIVLFRLVRSALARIVFVMLGSLSTGIAAMMAPPNSSTDSARYAWDGIVQNSGISPYRFVPAADSLARLRPSWLFPPAHLDPDGVWRCLDGRIITAQATPSGDMICTAINRPSSPTIYPPVSEAYFAVVRALVAPNAAFWPMQLGGLLLSITVTILLLLALQKRGMDVRYAALWAWCPLVAQEAVNNAHVDVLGVALLLGATLVSSKGRSVLSGVLVGLAAAVKFVPAIGAPPLLRRKPLRFVIAAAATFVLVYVPYVAIAGQNVLGFLPSYVSEEGYQNGKRFVLVSFFAPGAAGTVVAAILALSLVVVCTIRANPDEPWQTQVVLIGSVLLIVSPAYAWYALLLIPFIVLSHRWEWFGVPLAMLTYVLFSSLWVERTAFAVALGVVLIVSCVRWIRARRGSPEYFLYSPRPLKELT